jgi:hypothetical protein
MRTTEVKIKMIQHRERNKRIALGRMDNGGILISIKSLDSSGAAMAKTFRGKGTDLKFGIHEDMIDIINDLYKELLVDEIGLKVSTAKSTDQEIQNELRAYAHLDLTAFDIVQLFRLKYKICKRCELPRERGQFHGGMCTLCFEERNDDLFDEPEEDEGLPL